MNTAIPIRIRGNSQSLIDYTLTDHSKVKDSVILISDTTFRTTKNKEIDHRATSIVTEIEIKEPQRFSQKQFLIKRFIVKTSYVFQKKH